MIPCANPGAQYRSYRAAIRQAVTRVLESGRYVLGAEVADFERSFADFLDVGHVVTVGNGTDALVLALRSIKVGPGDEVITVSHTAVATVAAIIATGAAAVLVDVEPEYWTIDPESVAAAITARTKAIIAVHLYGQSADLNALRSLATKHKLILIEDCAQAAGAKWGKSRLGAVGDIGTFSFYPTKNLGAIGDGGAIATNDARLAERLRRLRQYGWDENREARFPGVNSRLDPLQAAILAVKLPKLDRDNARRQRLASRYAQGLAGLPVSVPATRPDTNHAFHLYVIRCRHRHALRAHLARNGIEAGIHYPKPVHRQRGYAAHVRFPKQGLGTTERLTRQILSLPLYPELKMADVDQTIASIQQFYRDRG